MNTQTNRDGESLRILGWFFAILGCLVLVATLWTLGNYRAMVVNLVSGAVLAGIGGLMIRLSSRLLRDTKESTDPS